MENLFDSWDRNKQEGLYPWKHCDDDDDDDDDDKQ